MKARTLEDDAEAAYAALSEAYEEPDETRVVGAIAQHRLPCVGGPFDGMELDVPPKGTQVVINASFGRKSDLRGPVIYEVMDTPQGKRLVFVGQPDQSSAVAEEMARRLEDETPKLILP